MRARTRAMTTQRVSATAGPGRGGSMVHKTKGVLAVVASLTLIAAAAACSTAEPPAGTSSSGGTGAGNASVTLCPNGGKALTDVYVRPKVKSSSNITVAVEEPAHDYNNNTASANNFSNSLFSLVQPSAWMVDSSTAVCTDGDLLASVTETSQSPLTVQFKIKPEAVWSDGVPVSCHDFYLQWLAAVSKATLKGNPAFDPAATTGFDQMDAPACSDGDKT